MVKYCQRDEAKYSHYGNQRANDITWKHSKAMPQREGQPGPRRPSRGERYSETPAERSMTVSAYKTKSAQMANANWSGEVRHRWEIRWGQIISLTFEKLSHAISRGVELRNDYLIWDIDCRNDVLTSITDHMCGWSTRWRRRRKRRRKKRRRKRTMKSRRKVKD